MHTHDKLAHIWKEVEGMLSLGLNLIPVRDRDQGDFVAKSPFRMWKKYQSEKITMDDLWAQMERYDTTAVAMVCGNISGGIEVIDIDSKYKEGVSGEVFSILEKTFPSVWEKLRVHRTPSGGYHLLYRVEGGDGAFPGNSKLAGREATDRELRDKPKQKRYYFLETRGEGGFVLMPPSLGYSVYRDNAIPVISWQERCDLISVLKSLNEIVEPVRREKRTKRDESYYDETPWEHYNRDTGAIPAMLQELGWNVCKEIGKRTYYTRPGKDKGISASFNEETNMLWVFTSSSDIQEEKGYSPSSLLIEQRFSGDAKRAYQYLTSQGYGAVKEKIEHDVVRKQALAGKPLPSNFSDSAKESYESIKKEIKEDFPYGIFWSWDHKYEKWKISREDIYAVSIGLGFRIYDEHIARIQGCFVEIVEKAYYYNVIKAYIKDEEADIYKEICNTYEAFLQQAGKFTIERLPELDTTKIIRDSAEKCYKFFQNKFICISANEIKEHEYAEVKAQLIWKHKVQSRNWLYTSTKGCLYENYLRNATGASDHVRNVIGWLCHEYKAENNGYIITLTEEVVDPKDGGGSGKNLFGNILRYATSVCTVPGSMVKFDERFMQPWNREGVYFLADLPEDIPWMFLKEMATGNGMMKKLYQNQSQVDVTEMPKLLMNTNYSYSDADGGLKRRIKVIEFTDFYTINGGVDVVHGKMFPSDFTDKDWQAFDTYIAECIQINLSKKGKIDSVDLSESGWQKKFAKDYGKATLPFIAEYIDGWLNAGFVSNEDFNTQYQEYCKDNDISDRWRVSAEKINKGISEYCKKYGFEFDAHDRKQINGLRQRGKFFSRGNGDDLPPVEDVDGLPF